MPRPVSSPKHLTKVSLHITHRKCFGASNSITSYLSVLTAYTFFLIDYKQTRVAIEERILLHASKHSQNIFLFLFLFFCRHDDKKIFQIYVARLRDLVHSFVCLFVCVFCFVSFVFCCLANGFQRGVSAEHAPHPTCCALVVVCGCGSVQASTGEVGRSKNARLERTTTSRRAI